MFHISLFIAHVDSKMLLDVEQKFKLAGVIALNVTTDGEIYYNYTKKLMEFIKKYDNYCNALIISYCCFVLCREVVFIFNV